MRIKKLLACCALPLAAVTMPANAQTPNQNAPAAIQGTTNHFAVPQIAQGQMQAGGQGPNASIPNARSAQPTATIADLVRWRPTLAEARQESVSTGKPMLLHFYEDNNVYCEKLDAGAYRDPVVVGEIERNFVPVKVYGPTNEKIADMLKVDRYPTDIVLLSDGNKGQVVMRTVSPQDPLAYVAMLGTATTELAAVRNALPANNPSFAGVVSPSPGETNAMPSGSQYPFAGPQPTYGQPYYANQQNPAQGPAQGFVPQQPTAFAPAMDDRTMGGYPAGAYLGNQYESGYYESGYQNANSQQPSIQQPSIQQPAGPGLSAPQQQVSASPGFNPPVIAQDHYGNQHSVSYQNTAGPDFTAASGFNANGSVRQTQPSTQPTLRFEAEEPMMEGYCLVTMVEERKWTLGSPNIGAMHLGRLYLFTSQSAREQFMANPDRYAPLMNGLDVVKFFDEGKIVPGIRSAGCTWGDPQRVLFFASEESIAKFERSEESQEYYSRRAIELTNRATAEANPAR
jgi:hypothetical protein